MRIKIIKFEVTATTTHDSLVSTGNITMSGYEYISFESSIHFSSVYKCRLKPTRRRREVYRNKSVEVIHYFIHALHYKINIILAELSLKIKHSNFICIDYIYEEIIVLNMYVMYPKINLYCIKFIYFYL